MHQDTRVIHIGEGQVPEADPLTTPIYETTTFRFASAAAVEDYYEGRASSFLYSRYRNPTVLAVEEKLAALDDAETARVFSSGMGAVSSTVMAHVGAGDEVVCAAAIYGGTLHFLQDVLARFGVSVRFAPLEELAEPDQVPGPATKLLWFESPINPTLRCVDIARVASACRRRGVISVVDSTFASPYNQQPLALGADLVMHSATKFLGGHSDVTAGVVAGRRDLVEPIDLTRRLLGTVLDPLPAAQLGRSVKTLGVRMARHNENARRVAEALEADPRVSRVYYPGLESHPDHRIAAAQMRGFGGMVSFDLGGDYERACRFFDRVRLFQRATSLGGVESLCSLPVATSQRGYTAAQLERAGVTPGMVRLSIGLEDPADLMADLSQALA